MSILAFIEVLMAQLYGLARFCLGIMIAILAARHLSSLASLTVPGNLAWTLSYLGHVVPALGLAALGIALLRRRE